LSWITFQAPSTTTAPNGSCWASTWSIARRSDAMTSASSDEARNTAAKPAAASSALRSRNGTSSAPASASTSSRLG
jgi:hypothetical protein